MKGIVLNEFLEYVEQQLGAEAVTAIVAGSSAAAGGRYQTNERYDHAELVRLTQAVAQRQAIPAAEVLCRFGRDLFGRFATLYPLFLADADDTVTLLIGIDRYIHSELQQLYPDGEFPTFHCRSIGPRQLEMLYESARPFADLAEGLIRGCADHYGENVEIRRETIRDGQAGVRFVVTTASR